MYNMIPVPLSHPWWKAHRQICDANNHVMEMINNKINPLTREDLHRLADKYPERWEKYRHLLDERS